MTHTTNIIIFLSPFVRDLIKKLLVHDRTRRLGSMKVSMYPSLQNNCRNRNLLTYSSYSNPLRYPLGMYDYLVDGFGNFSIFYSFSEVELSVI